jgi:hypothetical protein
LSPTHAITFEGFEVTLINVWRALEPIRSQTFFVTARIIAFAIENSKIVVYKERAVVAAFAGDLSVQDVLQWSGDQENLRDSSGFRKRLSFANLGQLHSPGDRNFKLSLGDLFGQLMQTLRIWMSPYRLHAKAFSL